MPVEASSCYGAAQRTRNGEGPLTHELEVDDATLIGRAARGDARGVEVLYDRHTPAIYALALRILRSPSEAEEVVQDTWVQLWRRASSFDPARGSAGAWILTMARSRAIDRYRSLSSRRRVEEGIEAHDAPAGVPDAGAAVVSREQHERVRAAFESLSPQHRRVLELAYFEGMSHSQIAHTLEAPLGTVKSWARQALVRMKALLPEGDLV